MLQALLGDVDSIRGVAVRQTIVFDEGEQVLAVLLYGVDTDDDGNLVYAGRKKS